MPGWLEIILNIVIFIVFLSVLILVHEAGHFATAKIFKVYCEDFSIGFGKAIFSKKRKGGETSFSLRIFPLGGFVAMAGEEGEVSEGLNIPKERTIAGIAKWKAAIVMSAGIIVNLIVSILLIYASNQFFITENVYRNIFTVKEGSIAEKAGIKAFNEEDLNVDFISTAGDPRKGKQDYLYYSLNSKITYENDKTVEVIAAVDNWDVHKDPTFDGKIRYYKPKFENTHVGDNIDYAYKVADFDQEINPYSLTADENSEATYKVKKVDFVLNTYIPAEKEEQENAYFCTGCGQMITDHDHIEAIESGDKHVYFHKNCPCHQIEEKRLNEKGEVIETINKSMIRRGVKTEGPKTLTMNVIKDKDNKLAFEEMGLGLVKESYWQGAGEAWRNTFATFAQGSGMIFTTIGHLFVGKDWDQVGSIISIYGQQSKIIDALGPQKLFMFWGLISVNLAIFNLLPFPGLDGWQLLVIAIEGITRKKIPDKVKTIVSYIGLGLVFALMAVLVIKDIIGLF